MHSLQFEKLTVNGISLLHFHDAVCIGREQQVRQPLALAVVSLYVFRVVAMRAFTVQSLFV